MWILEKQPRARKTCDYCNGGFGLIKHPTAHGIFCKLKCQEGFIRALYRPPDQFELPLHKPPETMPAN